MEPVPLRYLEQDDCWPVHSDARRLKIAAWRPEWMAEGKTVVYGNPWRAEERVLQVKDMGNGAGEFDCLDCEGTGVYFDPDDEPMVCWTCKGTGKDYVSI